MTSIPGCCGREGCPGCAWAYPVERWRIRKDRDDPYWRVLQSWTDGEWDSVCLVETHDDAIAWLIEHWRDAIDEHEAEWQKRYGDEAIREGAR